MFLIEMLHTHVHNIYCSENLMFSIIVPSIIINIGTDCQQV